MRVEVKQEADHDIVLYAMSLSHFDEQEDPETWWEKQRPRAIERARKMAHMHGGHNDFLTLTALWIELEAPLYLWKQLDRYQVGLRKLSTSTMHTLKKTGVTLDRFESPPRFFDMEGFNEWLKTNPPIDEVANELPDGFIQRRVFMTNYRTLQNIIVQRKTHRLPQWQRFCETVLDQVQHPEWLVKGE